ncbi:MAG: DedA family protein [Terriglobales bacterium]
MGLIMEGDATLVAATILAGEGYFELRWVVVLAIAVSALTYEAVYEIGAHGKRLKFLTPESQCKAQDWLHRRFGLAVLFFGRFIWGFRLVIPFASGLVHTRRRRFVWANTLGSAFWTAVVVLFGVALQATLLNVWKWVRVYQADVAVGIFLVGMAFVLGSIPLQMTLRRRKRQPHQALSLQPTGTEKR